MVEPVAHPTFDEIAPSGNQRTGDYLQSGDMGRLAAVSLALVSLLACFVTPATATTKKPGPGSDKAAVAPPSTRDLLGPRLHFWLTGVEAINRRPPASAVAGGRLGFAARAAASTVDPNLAPADIDVSSARDVTRMRQQLVDFIWGSTGGPEGRPDPGHQETTDSAFSSMSSLARIDKIVIPPNINGSGARIVAPTSGFTSTAYFFTPTAPVNRLDGLRPGP